MLQPETLFWIDSCLEHLCENKTFECLSCGSQVQWFVTFRAGPASATKFCSCVPARLISRMNALQVENQ